MFARNLVRFARNFMRFAPNSMQIARNSKFHANHIKFRANHNKFRANRINLRRFAWNSKIKNHRIGAGNRPTIDKWMFSSYYTLIDIHQVSEALRTILERIWNFVRFWILTCFQMPTESCFSGPTSPVSCPIRPKSVRVTPHSPSPHPWSVGHT